MARDIYAGEGDLDMARRQARKSTLHLVFAPTSGRQQAVPEELRKKCTVQ
ncbi:hypothetical protein QG37_01532 [Candidozyma auris]|uniref:Uncharacterized protein n=1 Tax=Candidozyma auris TaxID=498019 RepID=A0A0L0P5Z2_CANAR|nr:hypothetical protein QG37_01532 [[Candida] auris]